MQFKVGDVLHMSRRMRLKRMCGRSLDWIIQMLDCVRGWWGTKTPVKPPTKHNTETQQTNQPTNQLVAKISGPQSPVPSSPGRFAQGRSHHPPNSLRPTRCPEGLWLVRLETEQPQHEKGENVAWGFFSAVLPRIQTMINEMSITHIPSMLWCMGHTADSGTVVSSRL